MGSHFSIIVTTYSREKTGARIRDALLAGKLAACVQVMPICSHYPWKGKISRAREHLMLVKARTGRFEDVKKLILENHDYEVPEIISLKIDKGFSGYFAWMDSAMAPARSSRRR